MTLIFLTCLITLIVMKSITGVLVLVNQSL